MGYAFNKVVTNNDVINELKRLKFDIKNFTYSMVIEWLFNTYKIFVAIDNDRIGDEFVFTLKRKNSNDYYEQFYQSGSYSEVNESFLNEVITESVYYISKYILKKKEYTFEDVIYKYNNLSCSERENILNRVIERMHHYNGTSKWEYIAEELGFFRDYNSDKEVYFYLGDEEA